MPVDTSMYSNIQQPNPMQTLGNMVGIANAVQQNRALQNQNVQSGIDAQEMQSLQPVLRDTSSYTDERGNIDFNKFVPMVMQAAPKNGADVIQKMAGAQQQRAAAQNAISSQSATALQRASQAIFSIDPNKATPELLQQTAEAINKNFTDPQAQYATKQLFNNAAKVVAGTKPGDPMRATNFSHLAMMYQPIEAQQAINTPNAVQMGNGQQTWMQNTKPGVEGTPQYGMLPNSAVQQQLPPTTQVMQGNTPGYLGPQAAGQGPGGVQQKPGFVPGGLPAGAGANIEANVGTMNKHFESLQDSSQGNQLVQSLTGNIKGLAEKAVTGTLGDKQSYVNGLLAQFHIPGTGDLKTDTDLLEKNLNQLNLSSPASSDAARTLISAARPHSSMSPKAIEEASDQLAAQVQANMAIRNNLAGFKYANGGQGDSVAYQKQREAIEKVADPRVWQYLNLKPGTPTAQKFMQNLSPADRKSLIDKAGQLEKMGML